MMERVTGQPGERVARARESAGDVRHTGADTARARGARSAISPRVGLEEGLARMSAWMTRYLAGERE